MGEIAGEIEFLTDNHFDCIEFSDVLEHLADPHSVLQSTKSKFEDQGVIDCSIPNVRLEGIKRTSSLLVRLVNILSLGWFADTLYLQFACVARPK